MDKKHYKEMFDNFMLLREQGVFEGKKIFLFGHCNATEELMELLLLHNYTVKAILDNNSLKQNHKCQGIPIISPSELQTIWESDVLVCIVARAYASMVKQLRQLGFNGRIEKLVDYNSYSEYSLSKETIQRKKERVKGGIRIVEKLKERFPEAYRIYCPFMALGDVYYAMSYLPYFLKERKIDEYVVIVIGNACGAVAKMFGVAQVEIVSQEDMDESVQAVLYTRDGDAYIAHQDRPYTIYLSKALYVKKISLETMYKCGVFGLPKDTIPLLPNNLGIYDKLNEIPRGRSVILSPYAKSVTNIPIGYWENIIQDYSQKGYTIYTNVSGEEIALDGTIELRVKLPQMQSVVEHAGTFIGLRSGLCDVIKWANCKKIAVYPDAFYSDTKWKMDEIYHLDGWENVIIKQES